MPAQVTNYKCPSCTGPLRFDAETGLLACDYCGSTYTVAAVEALYAEKDEAAAAAQQQAAAHEAAQAEQTAEEGWDASSLQDEWGPGEGLKAYNCPSCGAELICDENTAATSCPYCGNPTIVPGQLTGVLKPDFVLPFKMDKAAALEALKNHYKGKKLLPKAFSNENHLEEIQGVYVPFWLYDAEADASAVFHATRSHTVETRRERVITTEHFDLMRSGTIRLEKIPVDASTRMDDDLMDSIEPFDYSELKTFSNAYLPGYLADKYDVSTEDAAPRADERAKTTAVSILAQSCVGYETVEPKTEPTVGLRRGKVHYALMPVWLLNTKWNGNDYKFAMNGQTGKFVGDLPLDRKRYWAWFAGIAVGVSAGLSLLATLLFR